MRLDLSPVTEVKVELPPRRGQRLRQELLDEKAAQRREDRLHVSPVNDKPPFAAALVRRLARRNGPGLPGRLGRVSTRLLALRFGVHDVLQQHHAPVHLATDFADVFEPYLEKVTTPESIDVFEDIVQRCGGRRVDEGLASVPHIDQRIWHILGFPLALRNSSHLASNLQSHAAPVHGIHSHGGLRPVQTVLGKVVSRLRNETRNRPGAQGNQQVLGKLLIRERIKRVQ